MQSTQEKPMTGKWTFECVTFDPRDPAQKDIVIRKELVALDEVAALAEARTYFNTLGRMTKTQREGAYNDDRIYPINPTLYYVVAWPDDEPRTLTAARSRESTTIAAC